VAKRAIVPESQPSPASAVLEWPEGPQLTKRTVVPGATSSRAGEKEKSWMRTVLAVGVPEHSSSPPVSTRPVRSEKQPLSESASTVAANAAVAAQA
jgi:hypothetical protein